MKVLIVCSTAFYNKIDISTIESCILEWQVVKFIT